MSRFIKTTSGYINQDHILLIRFGTTKEEEGFDLIQMSDGRIVQTQIMDFDWLDPEMRLEAAAAHHPPKADEPEAAPPETDVGFGAARPDDPKPKYDDDADEKPV